MRLAAGISCVLSYSHIGVNLATGDNFDEIGGGVETSGA